MKFLFLVMMTVFVGACAHKHHGHHGDHGSSCHGDKKVECACDQTGKAQGDKKAPCTCAEKCQCAHDGGCNHGDKKACCAEKACKHEGHQACTAETTNPLMSDKITQKISQEEFAKLYTKNKENLGKKCTTPAMTYCGKTTKDMTVSETEASCLWGKVFRVSRETMPELDGTPCAKMIKGFAKK